MTSITAQITAQITAYAEQDAAELPGFKVRPNAYDLRIECRSCGQFACGSLARAWAGSHHCPASA